LAQSVAALAEAAPGRFAFGLGFLGVIVEQWNGIPSSIPTSGSRHAAVRAGSLVGEKITETYDTFSVRGFRLARPPEQTPPIYLGALRAGMLKLAGREADGAILNWLSADDVTTAINEVGPGKEIVARIFVIPSEDTATARAVAGE